MIKKIILGSLLIILFLIGGAFYITTNGDLVKKIASWGQNKFLPELKMNQDALEIDIETTSLTKRQVTLNYDDCIQYMKMEFCFTKLHFKGELNFLSPLESKVDELVVKMSKGVVVQEEQPKSPLDLDIKQQVKSLFGYYKMLAANAPKKLDIELDNLVLKGKEGETSIQAQLNQSLAKVRITSPAGTVSLNLDKENDWAGELKVRQGELKINSQLSVTLGETLTLMAKPTISSKTFEARLNAKIELQENVLTYNLDTIKLTIPDQKLTVTTDGCQQTVKLDDNEDIRLGCSPFLIRLPKAPLLEATLNVVVNDHLKENNFIAKVDANLSDKAADYLKLSAKASLQVYPQRIDYGKLSWNLLVSDFSRLVQKLEGSAFAIPAPINTLEGKLRFHSQKQFAPTQAGIDIPFELESDLNDPQKNRLRFQFDGLFAHRFEGKGKSKVQGQLVIDEIKINIPDIDPLKGIPKLTPASRINKEIRVVKKKKESPLEMDITISSKSDSSIKIYYYLLKPYLSFGLGARIRNENISYKLYTDNKFKIVYLKRELSHAKTLIEKAQETTKIDTRFVSKVSTYELYLDVIGTLSAPKLVLSSYPSLAREDIISLLIYKKRSSSISQNQKQSVGGTQAAIAHQALGLFSIWAFASTPIDYVTYDPNTQSYAASISLPGEASLRIGTDWDSASSLTLRKQVSETWALETTYSPDQQNGSGQNVMLQKEISF